MIIDKIRECELDEAAAMIQTVFDRYVAPDFTPEGIREFKNFASADSLRSRLAEGSLVLVARCCEKVAGIIEMRFGRHISLLFTAAEFQRQGIAKGLVAAGVSLSRQGRPDIARITVNSSPYAVGSYKQMGFVPLSAEQVKYGIRFTPMEKLLWRMSV